MPRAAVRAAIQSYLAGASISHVTTVFKHPPKMTQESEILNPDGSGDGVAIFVHLAEQYEQRIAIGGANSGVKKRPYTCSLVCVFRSTKQDSQDVGSDNDDFIDSLTAAIEANRMAGAPNTIFQWGEGTGDAIGMPDIRVRTEMPRLLRGQISQIFSVVEVTVLEMLNT